MSSTRIPIPPTNLKERIAALEQRNAANGGATSRPISPTPSAASTVATNAPPAAFRDKIARFEKKGGVPVPRGSFGLGAPPTSQGPSRQGELYGNRIPAPARTVSIGNYPISRAASPTQSVPGSPRDRRSFSLSSVASDEDIPDYTPITSPTFAFPPDSPESVSVSLSPEPSPINTDVMTFNRPFIRGTSFKKAMEIARNAEMAKLDTVQDLGLPTPRLESPDDDEVEAPEPTPVIVVSSEDTKPVVLHDMPTIESSDDDDEVEALEPTHVVVVSSEDTKPVVLHDLLTTESNPSPLTAPSPLPLEATIVTSDSDSSLGPSIETQPALSQEVPEVEVRAESPSHVQPLPNEETSKVVIHEEPQPIVAPVVDVALEVVPLIIRKRQPTLPEQPKEIIPEVVTTPNPPPYTEEPINGGYHITNLVSDSEDINPSPSKVVANTIAPAQSPSVVAVKEDLAMKPLPDIPKEPDVSAPIVISAANPEPALPLPKPLTKVEMTTLPSLELPPPEIIVHDEPSLTQEVEEKSRDTSLDSSDQNDYLNLRKTTLTLDPELMKSDVPLSPALATGMSAMSLTDVMGNYFTSGLGTSGDGSFPAIPAPPSETLMSPPARLAYDSPEASPRPRVKAPDPQSFLSPPATGFLSAVPSSGGSSMGSLSSLGSRPMSMIETSPSHVTRALRMTPATSRGVPMFLPPNSARTRKSDFVHFPPTPDAEETEFGSVTLHKASQSMSDTRRRGSESDLGDPSMQPKSFTAIVHGKVRETPVYATMPVSRRNFVPETPMMKRIKRESILEPPMSPGQGELAALLQEAVWLEDALDQGTLPTEMARKAEIEEREKERERERKRLAMIAEAEAEAKLRQEKEERKRIEIANAQLQAKRDEPMSGKLKHTFLIPLAKARSVHHHRKEVSSSSQAENFPSRRHDDPAFRPKSAGVPDNNSVSSHQQQRSQALPQRPVTPENTTTLRPTETPTKSPRTSRFVGFRRLGSISARPTTMHGAPARYSNSTSSEISSEDSQAVATPPEGMLEFGMMHSPISEFKRVSNGSATSFPSLSPKKSTNSIGRATSFAEKMWSRARTKSSASNLSSTSEVTIDDSVLRLPALGPPPALTLSSMAPVPVPVIVHPVPEKDGSQVLHPPKRSASLKRTHTLPPIPTEPVPPLPFITATSFHSQIPQTPQTPMRVSDMSNDSLLTPGFDSTRPTSWTSVSSAGSLPSPLFDQALFDAFPSVPEATPTPDPMTMFNFPHRWDNTIPKASASALSSTQPSFDSALLSSAIHLASKTAATPSTATLNRFPSGRMGAATPVPVSRRSGESAR